jgi:hypothetical protein
MRFTSAVLIASLLSATGAFAADAGSLTAGKPAGVHNAQFEGRGAPLVYIAIVAVGIGIALALSTKSGAPTKTTTSTGTTG